jgi:hypothetical protein
MVQLEKCFIVMKLLFVLLLIPRQASTCTRFSSTGSGVVSVSGLVFDGCTSTSSGGAVSLSSSTLSAMITNCRFSFCSTSGGNGGAIYFSGCGLEIQTCWIEDCSASLGANGAVCAYLSPSSYAGNWTFENTLSTRCSGAGNTWYMAGGSAVDVVFTRSNVTDNSVQAGSSSCYFSAGRLFRFDFCAILSNHGSEYCIYLGSFSVSGEVIRCLSIRSNDGRGSSSSSVFSVSGTKTVNNSVIANHTNMGSGMLTGSGTLRFEKCFFDTFAFTWTIGTVITAGCVLGADGLPSDATCAVPPTAIFLPSASFVDSLGDRQKSGQFPFSALFFPSVMFFPSASFVDSLGNGQKSGQFPFSVLFFPSVMFVPSATFADSLNGELMIVDFPVSFPVIPTGALPSVATSSAAQLGGNAGLIAGIAVGSLVIVTVCITGAVIFCRRGNLKSQDSPLESVDPETVLDTQTDILQSSLLTGCPDIETDASFQSNKFRNALMTWDFSDD